MERGLIWLPLLALFIGLAWAGWNDYQKVEAYRLWAKSWQKSKYDIYAMLGYDGKILMWGTPTRQGPANLQTVPLEKIIGIEVLVDEKSVDLSDPPRTGKVIKIQLSLTEGQFVTIPFTEVPLALEWGNYLQQQLSLIS